MLYLIVVTVALATGLLVFGCSWPSCLHRIEHCGRAWWSSVSMAVTTDRRRGDVGRAGFRTCSRSWARRFSP